MSNIQASASAAACPGVTSDLCGAGPTFVAQWLFDQAQMLLFNVGGGRLLAEGQWNYTRGVGQDLRSTLQHVQ